LVGNKWKHLPKNWKQNVKKMPDFGIFAVGMETTLFCFTVVSLFLTDKKELLVRPKWARGPPEGPKKASFGRFRISEIITRMWPWEVAGGLSGVIRS
jgi:hypothetical protein